MQVIDKSLEVCKKCKYSYSNGRETLCDYANIMKKCRFDPPGKCTHFSEQKKRKKFIYGGGT